METLINAKIPGKTIDGDTGSLDIYRLKLINHGDTSGGPYAVRVVERGKRSSNSTSIVWVRGAEEAHEVFIANLRAAFHRGPQSEPYIPEHEPGSIKRV